MKTTIERCFRFGSSTRGVILPRLLDQQSDIGYLVVRWLRANGSTVVKRKEAAHRQAELREAHTITEAAKVIFAMA